MSSPHARQTPITFLRNLFGIKKEIGEVPPVIQDYPRVDDHIPQQLFLFLRDKFGIRMFVESGTLMGSTSAWASQFFDDVWTIEASDHYYQASREKYRHLTNIHFIFGNSKEKLGEILSKVNVSAIFWLDAHWSAGDTFGVGQECPLLDEIRAINKSKVDHFIAIDDARLFLAPPPYPHDPDQWPDISAVISELDPQRRYVVVTDDKIIAVPLSGRDALIRYCRHE